jgi:DNA-binding CsgD family transcriptional regulator
MIAEISPMDVDFRPPPNAGPERRDVHPIASQEHERIEIRLRQILVREAALLCERDELIRKLLGQRVTVANHFAGFTPRQCEIVELILAGEANKNIAADLGISQRTVENHRAAIMQKTGSKSLVALVRWALAATSIDAWNLGAALQSSSMQRQPIPGQDMPTGAFGAAASACRLGAG